eukprot:gnl/MRDRNA2_/MRDRNA2_76909_c0_seq1.p1 gnl/MRDRNA2_/MRDRNA2_76909_c0~~gnl/MRDRNA2_/MRDRNA2_76909_c0_seq1.p1  ORF type:complete len:349 (+),score=70.40 gnl/MRDRNA2_/MRDRNA2_76909_c0_seq1:193-1239(+)
MNLELALADPPAGAIRRFKPWLHPLPRGDVDRVNEHRLKELSMPEHVFMCGDSFISNTQRARTCAQKTRLADMMDKRVPRELRLRLFAQVICLGKIRCHGIVHGTMGKITDIFDNHIYVQFDNGFVVKVERANFRQIGSTGELRRKQFPLKLAYALERHDALHARAFLGSQSLLDDEAEVADVNRKRTIPDNVIAVQERVWKQRKFTDAVITCSGKRFEAHRAILSGASHVFEAAFSSSMQEGQSGVYEIKESTPVAVEGMLRFMYTGCISVPEEELAPLLELAVQYDLGHLADACAESLLVDLTAENLPVRAKALKRHSKFSTAIGAAWEEMLDKLQSDRELLALLV